MILRKVEKRRKIEKGKRKREKKIPVTDSSARKGFALSVLHSQEKRE